MGALLAPGAFPVEALARCSEVVIPSLWICGFNSGGVGPVLCFPPHPHAPGGPMPGTSWGPVTVE